MRTLVIGYGNPSRRDDGVGLTVINGLRERLGLPILDESVDGSEVLGLGLDTLFLQQLGPELAETIAAYDAVVFVDAHTGAYPELIRRTSLQPQDAPAMVSHHMKPVQLLALAGGLYHHAPSAELISVRGFDFDFGISLSPATAQAASEVISGLWARFGPRT